MFTVLMSLAALPLGSTLPADEHGIEVALSRCLGSSSANIPPASDIAQIPPGLIEGRDVNAVPIPGAGRAYSYEGAKARVVSCGIAIYGPVSRAERERITALVAGSSRWKPHAIDAYDLSKQAPGATETYWGDPLAPSMIGVAMLSRKPSNRAPTLEVQYHSIMVR